MELNNKKITFVIAMICQYGGNLIPSLLYLSDYLTKNFNAKISWILPYQEEAEWIKKIKSRYQVFYTHNPYDKTTDELYNILNQVEPDLVHTHFEVYDICVAKAIKRIDKEIKQVWHVHDIMSFSTKGQDKRLLRYLRRKIVYPLRYFWYGRNAYYIAVSHQMAAFVGHFRNHFLTTPPHYTNEELLTLKFPQVTTIINGMVESRLQEPKERKAENKCFTFLTFGGTFRGKGIDIVLDAGKKLQETGEKFQILITKGRNLEEQVRSFFGTGDIPEWVKIVPQAEDIASLFCSSDCYISASRGETMSFAIAEATYFLKPVIQSDIPGTYWNSKNPSVLLFKNEDSRDLYEKMSSIMKLDKEEIARKCITTKERNKQLLNIDKWRDSIINIYKTV